MTQVDTRLSQADLVDTAVDGYFGSVARRDTARIASLIAEECVMRIVSAGIEYAGKPAILAHFDDFLGVYEQISFTDVRAMADAEAQQVAVRFTISLEGDGDPIIMKNCNFFTLNDEGRFVLVEIYMSELPEKGF